MFTHHSDQSFLTVGPLGGTTESVERRLATTQLFKMIQTNRSTLAAKEERVRLIG